MFRTTARRQVEASEIAASARQFKDQVHHEIEALLSPFLRDGETLPDVSFLQELFGRLLDSSGTKVGETDGNHTFQLVSAASLRALRNQLSSNLRLRMRDVRYLVERSVEGPVFKAALRDRRLSKVKTVSLLQGARDLLAVLRDPELNVGGSDTALRTSAASFADALEAEALELERVLAQLSPRKRANQDSLGVKVADLQAAVETNRRCTDLLFGLYRVARLDYHASRLRERARRKPEKVEPPAAEAPVAEAPAAEAAAAPRAGLVDPRHDGPAQDAQGLGGEADARRAAARARSRRDRQIGVPCRAGKARSAEPGGIRTDQEGPLDRRRKADPAPGGGCQGTRKPRLPRKPRRAETHRAFARRRSGRRGKRGLDLSRSAPRTGRAGRRSFDPGGRSAARPKKQRGRRPIRRPASRRSKPSPGAFSPSRGTSAPASRAKTFHSRSPAPSTCAGSPQAPRWQPTRSSSKPWKEPEEQPSATTSTSSKNGKIVSRK